MNAFKYTAWALRYNNYKFIVLFLLLLLYIYGERNVGIVGFGPGKSKLHLKIGNNSVS